MRTAGLIEANTILLRGQQQQHTTYTFLINAHRLYVYSREPYYFYIATAAVPSSPIALSAIGDLAASMLTHQPAHCPVQQQFPQLWVDLGVCVWGGQGVLSKRVSVVSLYILRPQ